MFVSRNGVNAKPQQVTRQFCVEQLQQCNVELSFRAAARQFGITRSKLLQSKKKHEVQRKKIKEPQQKKNSNKNISKKEEKESQKVKNPNIKSAKVNKLQNCSATDRQNCNYFKEFSNSGGNFVILVFIMDVSIERSFTY